VFWIGGGSGAGKSTIANRLAVEHGLRVYATDSVMSTHAALLTAEEAPYLAGFTAMDMDERWRNRSPETMLATFHWFHGEGFDLIVDDLLRAGSGQPIIVEGFRLLPRLVAPLLADPGRAVWLLPTPEFRRAALESRGTAWDIPGKTGDPPRAQRNLLERDRLFTDRLVEETTDLGLRVIHVETGIGEDELATRTSRMLGL
jgi:2-phosphoglycerate kinase